MITRPAGPVAHEERDVDGRPGEFERLLQVARRVMEGPELYIHDVIIHGVRTRLHTDSKHVADFWREDFFGVGDWCETTGLSPPEQPQVSVYVFKGPEGAYYSRRHHAVLIFGTSWYGQVRSWALGAVGRYLADEYGVHLVRGVVFERHGKGVLCVGDIEHTTLACGLLSYSDVRLFSDDAVFIRYAYRRLNGQLVTPIEVAGVRGYRCFEKLEQNVYAKVRVLAVTGEIFETTVADLDLDSLGAYAFVAGRGAYVRTDVVRQVPEMAPLLLVSKLENVVAASPEPAQKADGFPAAGKAREALMHLAFSEHGRALVRLDQAVNGDRVCTDPLVPLKIDVVTLLTAERAGGGRLEPEAYLSRLLAAREVAYNGHRMAAEREWLRSLEEERMRLGVGGVYLMYQERLNRGDTIPPTLQQELQLQRVLSRCTPVYHLTADPGVSVRDAVGSVCSLTDR